MGCLSRGGLGLYSRSKTLLLVREVAVEAGFPFGALFLEELEESANNRVGLLSTSDAADV